MKKAFILFVPILLAGIPLKVFSQAEVVDVNLISNGNKLNAHMYLPASNNATHTLIMLHGYPGGEGDPLGLGKALGSRGINVLVFNYRGTWSSEGTFSFENSMEDIDAAISFLKNKNTREMFNVDTSNIIVAGYSYGGAMALTAAVYNPEIKRILSIAGADESVFGRKMLEDQSFRSMFEQMLTASEYPEGPIKCDIESFTEVWLSDLDKYDLVRHANSLADRDILFLGGWRDDNVVLEEHILPLYRRLQELESGKLHICVFDTDHSFRNVRTELKEVVEKWIKE